jgi:hypothetical protein
MIDAANVSPRCPPELKLGIARLAIHMPNPLRNTGISEGLEVPLDPTTNGTSMRARRRPVKLRETLLFPLFPLETGWKRAVSLGRVRNPQTRTGLIPAPSCPPGVPQRHPE